MSKVIKCDVCGKENLSGFDWCTITINPGNYPNLAMGKSRYDVCKSCLSGAWEDKSNKGWIKSLFSKVWYMNKKTT